MFLMSICTFILTLSCNFPHMQVRVMIKFGDNVLV